MNNFSTPSAKFERLRQQAEALIHKRPASLSEVPGSMLELIHELRIHQAELEMQNEELQRAQEALSDLYQEYEVLYEFAPCGYLTLNGRGLIKKANLTAVTLLGRRKAVLYHLHFTDFVEPGWESLFLAALKSAWKSEEKKSIELPLKRETDPPCWIRTEIEAVPSETGAVTQWRLLIVDISERKAVQAVLEKNEAFLRAVFESTDELICARDRQGCLVTYNTAFAEFLPRLFPVQAAPGLRTLDYLPPESRRYWEGVLERVLAGEHHQEVFSTHVQGTRRWYDLSLTPIIQDGEIIGTAEFTYDITHLKQVQNVLSRREKELQKLNQSLEQRVAERTAQLESRGRELQELALALSDAENQERKRIATRLHDDFQQQLAYIKLELGRIKRENTGKPAAKQLDFLEKLLQEVIEKSRNLSYELAPPIQRELGLSGSLAGLAEQMKQKHGLKVRLQTDPDGEPASLTLAAILYRFARELLINVVKHAGVDSADLSIQRQGEMIALQVTDKGAGFDDTAVRSKAGTVSGFGLYSIEDRTRFLGGSVRISSQPGKETSVLIAVPDQ